MLKLDLISSYKCCLKLMDSRQIYGIHFYRYITITVDISDHVLLWVVMQYLERSFARLDLPLVTIFSA